MDQSLSENQDIFMGDLPNGSAKGGPQTILNRRVGRQLTQSLNKSKQLLFTNLLHGNPAQENRMALVNPNDEPGKIPDAGDPFRDCNWKIRMFQVG